MANGLRPVGKMENLEKGPRMFFPAISPILGSLFLNIPGQAKPIGWQMFSLFQAGSPKFIVSEACKLPSVVSAKGFGEQSHMRRPALAYSLSPGGDQLKHSLQRATRKEKNNFQVPILARFCWRLFYRVHCIGNSGNSCEF